MKIKLSEHFSFKRLFLFVLPSIIMMVFSSIYGVIDGMFVSNIVGSAAFTAINLVMPFLMIFGGVGFMFGTGGSAIVAKTLGEKKKEKANQYFSMMIWVTIIVGVIISIIGIIFIRPIVQWLGNGKVEDINIIEYGITYGRIVLIFNIAFMLQNVFQSFLITAERPDLGLVVIIAAGVTNILLDALFIAVFKWGIIGAAIATGIGQCIGGLIPLLYFIFSKKSSLKFSKLKMDWSALFKACTNGISEFISNITASIIGMIYNFQLLKYVGADGVAAYGVIMYLEFVFVAIFIGYSIGCAPIVSYNFGADNKAELKNVFKKSLLFISITGFVMFVLAELLSTPIANIFVGKSENIKNLTIHGLRIFAFCFIFSGLNIFSSSFFTALNNGIISAVISILRTFVAKLVFIFVLPLLFNIDGIWLSSLVAEFLTCILCITLLIIERKKYQYI